MAKKTLFRRLMRRVILTLLGACFLIVVMIGIFRFVNPPTSAFMLIDQWQHSERQIQHVWVDIDKISAWMPLAVIASEDQTFLKHWGLEIDAILLVVKDYQKGQSLRGASTISQQTAKNLFLWNGRQFVRKILEASLTLGLECLWSKRRIMEVYLNIAEFGDGIYGVEAASQHFFGVNARQLTQKQAAQLAAVLPNPKRFNAGHPSAYISQRVTWILRQMRQLGGLDYIYPLLRKESL